MKMRNINQIKFRNLVSKQDTKVKKMFENKKNNGINHFDINNTFSQQILRGNFNADWRVQVKQKILKSHVISPRGPAPIYAPTHREYMNMSIPSEEQL